MIKACFKLYKSAPVTAYRVLFSIIACFAFIFCFDLVLHVFILMPCYLSIDAIHHAAPIDPARHEWYAIYQLAHAIVINVFYICWRYRSGDNAAHLSCNARYSDGAGFGGFVGLFIGITLASLYIYLPIPGALALFWAAGELFKGLGLGLVLTAVYPKPSTRTA